MFSKQFQKQAPPCGSKARAETNVVSSSLVGSVYGVFNSLVGFMATKKDYISARLNRQLAVFKMLCRLLAW